MILCDDFLNDYRVNGKKSLVRAERSVNHLKTSFDGAKVTNITTPRINAYILLSPASFPTRIARVN